MDHVVPGPASPLARAQLLLVLLLATVFPTLYVLTPQSRTHGLRFDWISPFDPHANGSPLASPVWKPVPPRLRSRGIDGRRRPLPPPGGARHEVGVTADGTFLFDRCALDAVSLRVQIDLLQAAGSGWLDLRPESDAPWETVDLALALLARARVDRFRFDNSRFARAIDSPPARRAPPPVRPPNCPALPAID